MTWIPLPVGVENFEDLRRNGYYFVDKTLFIKELLDMKGKVNLFTRPGRFGKTLNMSMLRYFFERRKRDNSELFRGLKIMEAGEKYLSHMGKYPVVSISLKSMKHYSFELLKPILNPALWPLYPIENSLMKQYHLERYFHYIHNNSRRPLPMSVQTHVQPYV